MECISQNFDRGIQRQCPCTIGRPGQRTLKNFLAIALEPVGRVLYVYGGGWNLRDTGAGRQALSIGLCRCWEDFFRGQDGSYRYREDADPEHSYYPQGGWNRYCYAGLDCSGYVGWALYNLFHTKDCDPAAGDGYVGKASEMADSLARRGWGTVEEGGPSRPGDICSMEGHVWISAGSCCDDSVLLLHSTPSNSRAGAPGGGVQLSALNPRSTGKACQAFQIADFYMKSRCPDWSRRYETTLQEYRRYACCRRFSWRVNGEILSDPDGYAQMRGEAVMADLLGSCP